MSQSMAVAILRTKANQAMLNQWLAWETQVSTLVMQAHLKKFEPDTDTKNMKI